MVGLGAAQWDSLMMNTLPSNCTGLGVYDACLAPNGRAGQCRDGNRCDFLPAGTICAQVIERLCYGACEQQSDVDAPCWDGENRGRCAFGPEAFCNLQVAAPPLAAANCGEADVGKACAADKGADVELVGKCAVGCPHGPDGEEVQCVRAQPYCDLREQLHAARIAACKSLMPSDQCRTDTMRGACKFGGACYPGYEGACIALAVLQCQAVSADASYWRAIDACAGRKSADPCSTSDITDGACGYGSNCPPSVTLCDKSATIQCLAKPGSSPTASPTASPSAAPTEAPAVITLNNNNVVDDNSSAASLALATATLAATLLLAALF